MSVAMDDLGNDRPRGAGFRLVGTAPKTPPTETTVQAAPDAAPVRGVTPRTGQTNPGTTPGAATPGASAAGPSRRIPAMSQWDIPRIAIGVLPLVAAMLMAGIWQTASGIVSHDGPGPGAVLAASAGPALQSASEDATGTAAPAALVSLTSEQKMVAVLDAAGAYRQVHGTFVGFGSEDPDVRVAATVDLLAVSVGQPNGTCLAGFIDGTMPPAIETDPSGESCDAGAMARVGRALDEIQASR